MTETRLKAERQRRGWSQTALAYRAKLTPGDVSKIERGILRPYPRQAARLGRALQLAPDELLAPVEHEA